MSGKVLMEVYGAIATITVDAPASRNALTPQMLCMLADAIKEIASSPSLRVAILTGAGEKAFCAGGDLARTLPLIS
jgi:enoyl-CoA hydratase